MSFFFVIIIDRTQGLFHFYQKLVPSNLFSTVSLTAVSKRVMRKTTSAVTATERTAVIFSEFPRDGTQSTTWLDCSHEKMGSKANILTCSWPFEDPLLIHAFL